MKRGRPAREGVPCQSWLGKPQKRSGGTFLPEATRKQHRSNYVMLKTVHRTVFNGLLHSDWKGVPSLAGHPLLRSKAAQFTPAERLNDAPFGRRKGFRALRSATRGSASGLRSLERLANFLYEFAAQIRLSRFAAQIVTTHLCDKLLLILSIKN